MTTGLWEQRKPSSRPLSTQSAKGAAGPASSGLSQLKEYELQEGGANVEFSILPGKVLSSTGNGRWALTAGLGPQRRNTCTKADSQTWLIPHTRVRHANLWWVASTPKVAARTISSATWLLTQQPSDSKRSQPAGEQGPLPASSAGPPDVQPPHAVKTWVPAGLLPVSS